MTDASLNASTKSCNCAPPRIDGVILCALGADWRSLRVETRIARFTVCARSADDGASHRAFLEAFDEHRVSDSRRRRNFDRAGLRHRDGRVDEVFRVVALARRDVAGKREPRKARERDVVEAPDAALEKSAAPDRD